MDRLLPRITLLTAVCICSLVQVKGQQETTAAVTQMLSTTPAALRLNVVHMKSSTNSIQVNWTVPNGYELQQYYIQAKKVDSDSLIRSPYLSLNESDYEITDLMTNSDYQVCIVADMTGRESKKYMECIDSFTIPLIRVDSIVVLCCVLGYLLLMILIGYLCWRRAHKNKEQEVEEDEIKAQENGDQSKPILLVTPPESKRPRSVIEDDADIPYITPTWEQLEKENQLRARQGHTQSDG